MQKWIFTTLLSYAQAVTVWGKISIYDLCKLKKRVSDEFAFTDWPLYETKYSRMDQVKFVEHSL